MTKIDSIPLPLPLILNGREVASEVLQKARNEINLLKQEKKRIPGLAVILVGENPASHTYVKNKEKTCIELGMYSEVHRLPASITEPELIKILDTLNNNKNIDGILVQLPLPSHIKVDNIINKISPEKDVDGLNPYNLGKLVSGQNCLTPCTPQGVIEILKHYAIKINGMHAVVVGRSNLVGKPLSILLLQENATVTITHSKTKNLEDIAKSADLLICAIGKANLVNKNWVKPGAIVIDVGINKIIENGVSKLVGDVDYKSVSNICQAITPVPGGVGPVTIAMLISNTMKAYKMRSER